MFKRLLMTMITALVCAGLCGTAQAQNTAFTFQGRLTDAGSPANGLYDLKFNLYELPTGGSLLGTLTHDDVMVTNGIFTVQLDYGSPVFTSGAGRFLEIGVRPGASTEAFTPINPRQELTAAPYSIQAVRAQTADFADNASLFSGLLPVDFLRSGVGQVFNGDSLIVSNTLDVRGSLLGSGANLTNLNAGSVSSGTLADARLSSNVPLL